MNQLPLLPEFFLDLMTNLVLRQTDIRVKIRRQMGEVLSCFGVPAPLVYP
jgi:hypothetical protein